MKPSNGITPKRVPESDSSEPGQWKSHFLLVEFSVMTQKLRIIYNLVRKKWRVKKKHSGSSVKGNKKKRIEFPTAKKKKILRAGFEPAT